MLTAEAIDDASEQTTRTPMVILKGPDCEERILLLVTMGPSWQMRA